MNRTDSQARAQEAEYAFPYHYIPALKGAKFSSTRHWDWGFRYLGGMQLALDQLAKIEFTTLVDIGCGDGRFLREVAQACPGKQLLGIDASERAIRLAQALNPELDYRAGDITQGILPPALDAATLIEVIEHIPPPALPDFLATVAAALKPGGHLLITVPHRNKPLIEKHYQHFSGEQLQALLAPHFEDLRLIPFDVSPRGRPLLWLTEQFLGAKGKWFLFTNARVLYRFYRLYLRRYLYAKSERDCERIAVVARRRASR
jgi:SAM-dependent methyltransferase